MRCADNIPVSDIAVDVARLIAGDFITVDNPDINAGVFTNSTFKAPSLRGDVILDSAARAAILRILSTEYDEDLINAALGRLETKLESVDDQLSEAIDDIMLGEYQTQLGVKVEGLSDDVADQKLDTGITAAPQYIGSVARTQADVNTDRVSSNTFSTVKQAIDSAAANNYVVHFEKNTTILIPSDCSTLQKAIDYTTTTSSKVKVVLQIESGHKLTHGLRIEDGDFSNYSITSADTKVFLSGDFTPVDATEWPTAAVQKISIFAFINCRSPVLKTLIDAELADKELNGYMCGFGGDYVVASGAGVGGARTNLECREGVFHGGGSQWINAYEYSARFTSGTFFSCRDALFENSFIDPELGDNNIAAGGVLVSRASYGTLQGSRFYGHPLSGISVRRSHCVLIKAVFKDITGYSIYFHDGGIAIINFETAYRSEDLVDRRIVPSDISIEGFNAIFRRGMCLNSGVNPIEIKTNTVGTLIKFPDGRALIVSKGITQTTSNARAGLFTSTTATFDYSSLISLDSSFTQISTNILDGSYAWVTTRRMSADRINYTVFNTVNAETPIQITVSGYWVSIENQGVAQG